MSTRDSYIFFDQNTVFRGEINTDHIILEGRIAGNILATKDVFLKKGSVVKGEISTKKFTIEEGATHVGKLLMGSHKKEGRSKNPEVLNTRKTSQSTKYPDSSALSGDPKNNGSAVTNGMNTTSPVNGTNGANPESE